MTPEEIRDRLAESLGIELEWQEGAKGTGDAFAVVPAAQWKQACFLARDSEDLAFDFLRSFCGTDRPEEEKIELVAHLFSYQKRHAFVLKTKLDRANPEADTVSGVWPAANWYERECYDLLGVNFLGHEDLRRIMLPDDWQGHPLRKDYKDPPDYRGIPTQRPKDGASE